MRNAKKELLNVLCHISPMKCAMIKLGYDWDEDAQKVLVLKLNFSSPDLDLFLGSLDFSYDAGYGGQYLHGIVWLEDGTWLSRGEYDGSEWWDHNELPEVPESCL
jgi:hypothetical protein